MGVMASQIPSLRIDYSALYSDTDQRKHQSSASLALWGESAVTIEFPAQRPIMQKKPFDDVIMSINPLPEPTLTYGHIDHKE